MHTVNAFGARLLSAACRSGTRYRVYYGREQSGSLSRFAPFGPRVHAGLCVDTLFSYDSIVRNDVSAPTFSSKTFHAVGCQCLAVTPVLGLLIRVINVDGFSLIIVLTSCRGTLV